MSKVLVVCTGNICRSPMGEIVLAAVAASRELSVEVDSAGTSAYEVGNPIDPRAHRILDAAGYAVPGHTARQVRSGELSDYDLVLAMTAEHQDALRRRAKADGGETRHIRLWREFDPTAPQLSDATDGSALDVPDPWFGKQEDFVETLELVEAAIDGILAELA